MSLINTMLRDLENRRASEMGRRDWQREIRALPPARSPSARFDARHWLGAVAGAAVVLLGVWILAPKTPVVTVDMLPAPMPLPDLPAAPLARSTPPQGKNPSLPAARAGKPESRVATVPSAVVVSTEHPVADKTPPAVVLDDNDARPLTKAERRRKLAADKAAAKEAARMGEGEQISKTMTTGSGRERAEAEFRRGQGLAAGGQSGEAVAAWYGALSHDPSYIPARQSLVRVLLETQRSDDAAALLSEGLDAQPNQIAWAMSLARLRVERQDVAGAAKVLARAQAYAGNSADFAGFQGHLAFRLGNFANAAERYQSAVVLAAGEGRWWFGLGQAKEAEGKPGEAQEAYRRALACGNLPASLTALAEQKLR